MRTESSVTSGSWIPPAAITGLPRAFFEHGVTHYDARPPHEWTDLDSVLGPEGAGIHAPRHVHVAPFAKIQSPTIWTTLALTIHADGSVSRQLVSASSFPRHWIYDADGRLAGQSTLIDFKTWYRTATFAHSPWNGHDRMMPGGRPNR